MIYPDLSNSAVDSVDSKNMTEGSPPQIDPEENDDGDEDAVPDAPGAG
jgi:hypothetical protein